MSEANKPILLTQCKAYHSIEDVSKEIETLFKIVSANDFRIYISLPYSYVEQIQKKIPGNHYAIGVEALLDLNEESFTASISAKMLKEVNAQFVLIGTPEERASHPDVQHHMRNKIRTAIKHQIQPIFCIADTLQQHQDKVSKEALITQINDSFKELTNEELKNIYIAYTPEWICRTPWEANSSELQEAYSIFREVINGILGTETIAPHQLIVAIPGYSQDVPSLIESLKSLPSPFAGYSLGILSSSAEYLQPLIKKEA